MGDKLNAKLEMVYMFVDAYSEDRKDEVQADLEWRNFRPRITEIFGGELDGKYDISLPLTDFILYYRDDIEQMPMDEAIGSGCEIICEQNLEYAIERGYSDYKIDKCRENLETIKERKSALNNNDFGNIIRLAYIEECFFSFSEENKSNVECSLECNGTEENLKSVVKEVNLNERIGDGEDFIFNLGNQEMALKKRYSLDEIEKINVLLHVDNNSSGVKKMIERNELKGYCPKKIAVPQKNGDSVKVENYIAIPFYAFIDSVLESHSNKPAKDKEQPLGWMLVRACRNINDNITDPVIKRRLEVLDKAISDNMKYFNRYKFADAKGLFEAWKQRQETRQR